MEDFLFPVSQYSMCQRMISLAFVKAEKKERSQLLFHYLCHFFINKEAFCFFLRLELRLTGHRGEWGFVRREVVIHTSPEPTRKMETVPCKVCHTRLLGLLKVGATSVALWIWGNLRSAQIPRVGLTSRHH